MSFRRSRTRTMVARAVAREGRLELAARLRLDPPALDYWHRTGELPAEVRALIDLPPARLRSDSAA